MEYNTIPTNTDIDPKIYKILIYVLIYNILIYVQYNYRSQIKFVYIKCLDFKHGVILHPIKTGKCVSDVTLR